MAYYTPRRVPDLPPGELDFLHGERSCRNRVNLQLSASAVLASTQLRREGFSGDFLGAPGSGPVRIGLKMAILGLGSQQHPSITIDCSPPFS